MSSARFTAWHYAPDALPQLVQRDDGNLDLLLLVGAWSDVALPAPETVRVTWTASPRAGVENVVAADAIRAVDRALEAQLRADDARPVTGPRPLALGPYRLPLSRLDRGNRYHEVAIRDVVPGTEIEYRITVIADGVEPVALGPYSVLVTAPEFGPEHMIGGRVGSLVDPGPAWIGHVRHDDGVTHVRIDLDDIPAEGTVPLRIGIGGVWYEVNPADVHRNPRGRVPFVDWYADTVTVSAPDPDRRPVVVDAYGRMVDEAAAGGRGRARLLVAHFCIQAVNDLLEVPFDGAPKGVYGPPRTYMQVTMRDEDGLYSSRPGVDKPNGGGYVDGLTMHRRFGVPYHLALNGGVLVLAAHDCADDLDTLRADVASGLARPAIAGYGSHRIPYYSAEANIRDVTACLDVLDTYLEPRSTPTVFYPDQRLYRQRPETVELLDSPHVEYVVLDSATGYYDNVASVVPGANAAGCDLGPTMLWTDETTTAHVLFIDTTLKDTAFGGDSWAFGKPDLAVRRRFMRMALDPRLRERNLLVYGDDFEKACNNGWFEHVSGMRERWAAFLEWVAAHRSWLQVVTAEDLDPDADSVGTIDVVESIDATLDPGGIRTKDVYGNPFHYDTWQRAWSDTEALWIGGTLGEITDTVETALRCWPDDARDQLHETAWLAFLMDQHENAWNMQALEGGDPNLRPIGDPEEFTVVEGLQVRNVLVWLKASLWARWARNARPGETWVDDGPVFDAIRRLPDTVGVTPAARDLVRDPQRWDGDPLETAVLYNTEALVVVDRNGGRVTHAFVLRDGVPRTVSGTFKSYQYRDSGGRECDGPVVQNTVWTPNHRYVGTDLDLLHQRTVRWPQNRPGLPDRPAMTDVERTFPDNFNAYDCDTAAVAGAVVCTYTPKDPPAADLDAAALRSLLEQDGRARRDGVGCPVVWHALITFVKTFTLRGSTLEVSYTGVPVGHLVDNEFCVDLFAGAQRRALLTREVDRATGTAVIAMPGEGAVMLRTGSGCEITPDSSLRTVEEATAAGRVREFLSLHRVLTEAVQLRATASEFDYAVELDATRAEGPS
jgi:hypothetical protein